MKQDRLVSAGKSVRAEDASVRLGCRNPLASLPFYARYVMVVLAVASAAALRLALHGLFGQGVAFITFYPAVVLVAMFLGARAGVVATLLSAAAANYFLMPPYYSLAAANPADVLALGLFVVAGLLISWMAGLLDQSRRREAEAAERERSREQLLLAAAETAQQKELLAVTLASIGDAVIVTDVQGHVTFLNGEAERLTGWTSADAVGQPLPAVFNIVNEQTRQIVENPVDKVLRLGTVVALANHTILIAKDGQEFPIDDSGAPIRQVDGSVAGVVLVFRDFTERKAVEETLRNSEATLRGILDATKESIWLFSPDGVTVMGNQTALQRWGKPADTILHKHWSQSLPPDLARTRLAYLKQAVETAQPVAFEDGRAGLLFEHSFYPVTDAGGRVTCVACFSRDITERRQAEEVLAVAAAETERQRQLLAVTLASIGDAVIVTDVQGRVTFLNGEAERLTGWTNAEATDQPLATVFNIINEQTRQIVESPADKVLRLGTVVELANHTVLIAKDGREIPIDDSGAPIRQADGTIEGVVLVFRDFTERQQKAKNLRRLNRTLTALSKSSQTMMRAQTEPEYLDQVCDIIVKDCGHAMVWIGYAENDEGKTVRPVAHAGFEKGYLDTLKISWADTERGRGPTGTAIRTGKPSMCQNMLTDPAFAPWREHAIERGYASSLVLPMVGNGGVFGALTIYSRQPNSFSEDEVNLLTELVNDLSYGISAIRLRLAHAESLEMLRQSEQRVRLKLDSILSPEGDLGILELGDIIDAPAIQKLMDNFHELAHIPMAIIDIKGKVLVGVGWQDICTKYHRVHPETCKHCIESDTLLAAGAARGEFKLYKCRNNMWDMATPIVVGGKHVGNLFMGQFFFEGEDLPYDLFRLQARQYGFPEQEYLAALERVPRLNRQAVDTAVAFFLQLSQTLSQLSYSNVRLARSLAERDALTVSLRDNEERLNRAQRIAQLGSWELDLLHNRLSWSDEVYRIFGLQPQEFAATYEAFLEAVHPDDRLVVDDAYSTSLREERDSYEIEHRVVRKADGEVRIVHEKCQHVRDDSGRIVRSVGMVHDITARRQAEQELRESRQQLQAANQTLEQRVAERTAVAEKRTEQLQALASRLTQAEQAERQRLATILHDHLQQLLVGTKFHLGMLRNQSEPAQIRQMIGQIDSLLDQSLETSRNLTVDLSPPILTHGNMPQVLQWLADWMRSKHGLEVKLHVDEHANPQAHEVRVLLFQATRELLFNIVKHAKVDRATVELCRLDDGQHVRVTVRDSGVGFDSAKAHTHSASGSGFGLLAITERLDWLNGTFHIQSTLGHGTCATLTVPLAVANANWEASQAAIASASPDVPEEVQAANHNNGGKIRVLLADDHVVMRDGLGRLLDRLPDMHVIGKAADGQEAVEMAIRLQPDVVIMDVNMPEVDGLEATRQIVARHPQVKVIGLSMFNEEGVAESMKAAGAAHYLAKTSGPEALIAAIREYTGKTQR